MIKQRSQCNCPVTFCNQFSTTRAETSPSWEANCLLLTCKMVNNFTKKMLLHHYKSRQPAFSFVFQILHFRLKIWGGMGVAIDVFLVLHGCSRRPGAYMKIERPSKWRGRSFRRLKKLCMRSDVQGQLSVIVLKYRNHKAKELLILAIVFNLFFWSLRSSLTRNSATKWFRNEHGFFGSTKRVRNVHWFV